ncbi:MAG TPA: VWA domain-containing protein, partial [Candidatus Dormibacteraeota bacterium]|nr:VWA domain-containing protein [Candidatus Dormibacteraeota bacterium]
VNVVEREGVSVVHPARFILVGTMNPEEGELRPQLLDRFGLCVDVEGIDDPDLRVEIAERDAAFRDRDPAFVARFQAEDRELASRLQAAIAAFPRVSLSQAHARAISAICLEAGVQGHRGDVVTGHTARALAALRGRLAPNREDIYDAAELALAHRARARIRRDQQEHQPTEAGDRRQDQTEEAQPGQQVEAGSADEQRTVEAEPDQSVPSETSQQGAGADEGVAAGSTAGSEAVPEASQVFAVRKIELPRKRVPRRQTGKRTASMSRDRRGRYVRARAQEKVTDLALDATVRAAAPHQVRRGRQAGERLKLERHDLHQKVRERKVGNLIVFVVDASASMDAEQRMAATKGAILSLLQDAYVRRDRVAVVVFKNRSAEVVLQPTSSVSLAQRRLERLSVGGTTPLTHGLMTGYKVVKTELTRDPSIRPLLVLISDGRGNISMFKEEPLVEAQKVAALINAEKIDALVIDSARDFSHLPSVQHLARVAPMYQTYAINACADLAERMGARYFGLYDLSREEIATAVANQLRKSR